MDVSPGLVDGLWRKNSWGNTLGVKPHFLLSLGSHSKQAGDERHLPYTVPYFDSCTGYLAYPFLENN